MSDKQHNVNAIIQIMEWHKLMATMARDTDTFDLLVQASMTLEIDCSASKIKALMLDGYLSEQLTEVLIRLATGHEQLPLSTIHGEIPEIVESVRQQHRLPTVKELEVRINQGFESVIYLDSNAELTEQSIISLITLLEDDKLTGFELGFEYY